MEYNFPEIEKKWQQRWRERGTYRVSEQSDKPKFYVLDMFPYPSGAGLHVGHPLGYIASDIFARYKRHRGFNVLHPMGYDSFGLPAEQYAIQTGQHPAITTSNNIARYREQLDKIGFCYDWDREVRTSDPSYYKWTQWIFGEIFQSWYNKDTDKAEHIDTLIAKFEENGTYGVNAACDDRWWENLPLDQFFFGSHFDGDFTATDWKSMNDSQKATILMQFRLAYLADSVVNWCPALGTVLANDEIKDGLSERGGHPVEQKKMRQWSMRISAYAERLLQGLDTIDWSDSIKEVQRNWIGRSEGALVRFEVEGGKGTIEVFTTRPDTIFGVSFLTLAPEHDLVTRITTGDQREAVDQYIAKAKLKTERDRQADVKNVTGQFTGAYAIHPFTGVQIPIWIGEYVLAGYGTGAVMAVPAGDQRDYDFAKKFDLAIPNIFKDADISEKAEASKDAVLSESDFLNGLSYKAAMPKVIEALEKGGFGEGRINYRMRDAVFSRQRYWGEPFPVYYNNGIPQLCAMEDFPIQLPEVDKYLPTESGEPPLARAKDWNYKGGALETNTMPGWAGSSWYFLRYMDPQNEHAFVSREKADYWSQVDLYMGGAEHGTGHLLYSRFWTKILFDLGYIGFDEPFKKMINQGMILGRSSFLFKLAFAVDSNEKTNQPLEEIPLLPISDLPEVYVTMELADLFKSSQMEFNRDPRITKLLADLTAKQKAKHPNNTGEITIWHIQRTHVDISFVDNDNLNKEKFIETKDLHKDILFIANDNGQIICDWEVEKMSKSKFNVQTPDELVEKFGADTLRCYEMFLGPVEQSKPWDTKGINGVHNFLRRFWRLYHDAENNVVVNDAPASKESLKTIHKTIKKITEDLDRFSWNTCVSAFMICTNELTDQKCNSREVLESLCILLAPFAPHIAEEIWERISTAQPNDHSVSVFDAPWPAYNEQYLQDNEFDYPVSFNGKTRFNILLGVDLTQEDVIKAVLAHDQTAKYLEGKEPKKVIVVPKRIVNVVV